ncbi:hypothetical protein F4806DRAFT_508393 [Annulohypoxylon nitens]|nr:hypothetical protein F4806DRAFT_508393 [Annulohypoxylon nitens]
MRHFERIKGWSRAGYHDMLLFDDTADNIEVETWLGVTFHKLDKNSGITMQSFREGVNTWRRNLYIRFPMPTAALSPNPNIRQVGWVGTDLATGMLYFFGERRSKAARPSRWGWALYVSDDPSIAAEFARWLRAPDDDDACICEVYVRDYEAFLEMNKVWVPENGSVPQTDINWDPQEIANVQIERDEVIANMFGVSKPYILFSRHHWMDFLDTTWRKDQKGTRFSEMVVPPQVQDALFFGIPFRLSEVQSFIDNNAFSGYDYRHKLRMWNIKSSRETEQDFVHHKERFA